MAISVMQNLNAFVVRLASTNKQEILNVVKHLGSGYFGSVQLVMSDAGQQFALKTIDITKLHGNERIAFLRTIQNEVANLKKMGLLQGFTQNDSQIQILMTFVEGSRAGDCLDKAYWDKDTKTYDAIVRTCFKALCKLHAKGILHGDCHDHNFLMQPDGSAVAIDLGLSTRATWFNFMQDYQIFAYTFLHTSDFRIMANLFIETTIEYIIQNKFEMAIKTLSYGACSLGLIYGIAFNVAVRSMVWSYAQAQSKNLAYDFAYNKLERMRRKYLFDALWCANVKEIRPAFYFPSFLMTQNPHDLIAVGIIGIIFAIDILSDLKNHMQKVYACIDEAKQVYSGKKKIEVNGTLLLQVFQVALLCYPVSRAMHMGKDAYYSFVATEQQIINSCTDTTYSKGFLSYFGLAVQKTITLAERASAKELPRLSSVSRQRIDSLGYARSFPATMCRTI